MAERELPTPPVPKPKKERKRVWVACRARQKCEGKTCEVVWSKKKPGGGRNTRYKCTACGGAFHIST